MEIERGEVEGRGVSRGLLGVNPSRKHSYFSNRKLHSSANRNSRVHNILIRL